MTIPQNMGFATWNTQQPGGFQNVGGSSQQNAVDLDDEEVPETQFHVGENVGEPQKKKRSHKRKPPGEECLKSKPIPWTSNEEMSLSKAWLEITEHPRYSNYQKEKTYWSRIYKVFLKLEDQQEGYRDADGIGSKWRKMRPLIQSFNQIYTRLNNSSVRQSGSDDAMLQANAQNEFRAEHRKAFPYLAIWQVLRKSSKFHIVIAFDPFKTRGQPSAKRSKTSSSNDNQSQGSDARCQINLNDIEEDLEEPHEEDNAFEPPQRPVGRDRAKKAAQPSSSGVRIDYTETFEKVTNKLDGLLQTSQQRLNLKKEHGDRKLKPKESRQKALDLQILTTDTTNLSGVELALAEQMKQEIREKYNLC
ncbi:glutathione S-transferase T3-like [Helianthus annuus]|uniref:glutathione S-transferase T3-like n=1 Tax=Helianthus annuus TaxID=4232 RepID=UPI000B8F2E70|nr:glutathione S-transferase T3-like [Helianthus annuus]